MARILEFRHPVGSAAAQGAEVKPEKLPEGHSADIIMFPGPQGRSEGQPGADGSDNHPEPSAKQAKHPTRRDR